MADPAVLLDKKLKDDSTAIVKKRLRQNYFSKCWMREKMQFCGLR